MFALFEVCIFKSNVRSSSSLFLSGTSILGGSDTTRRHSGLDNAQTVATDQGQDVANTCKVPLRVQPARPQSNLAGQ